MLTRTTAQRVYNDSYLDRVAENGIKLVKVTALGAPECEVCRAWQGVICSIDGTARGLPSIESAKAAGVFHPNCVCIHEAVIEEIDKTELAIQRKHPFTKDIRDLDAYEARKFAIDRERYERKGLSAEEARIAVNRDNLELAIRNGLIRSDAREIVDGLTDTQVAALCPDGKTPRFEPVKKGDTAKIVRGSRGGVVHIARDADLKHLVEVLDFDTSKRLQRNAGSSQSSKTKWERRAKQSEVESRREIIRFQEKEAQENSDILNLPAIKGEHTPKDDIKLVNQNYSRGDPWQKNCQRCVTAFELRCRGIDVVAKSKPEKKDDKLWHYSLPYKGIQTQKINCKNKDEIYSKFSSEIMSENSPLGSRYILFVAWESKDVPISHVLNAIKEDDGLTLYDAQINRIFKGEEAQKYLGKAETEDLSFCRVDNLEIDEKYLKYCVAARAK